MYFTVCYEYKNTKLKIADDNLLKVHAEKSLSIIIQNEYFYIYLSESDDDQLGKLKITRMTC